MRGPIKEKATGRFYSGGDDVEDDIAIDIDNVATRAPQDTTGDADTVLVTDDATTDGVTIDNDAAPVRDDETDDQK